MSARRRDRDTGAAYEDEDEDRAYAPGEGNDEDEPEDGYADEDEYEDEDQDEYVDEDEDEDEYEDEDQDEDEYADEDEDAGERAGRRGPVLSAMEAGRAALEHIRLVSTRDVEGVTSVRRSRDGWTVEVELLDARHIPSSADRLALYEVDIDERGELMSYQRVAQYSRARGREAR